MGTCASPSTAGSAAPEDCKQGQLVLVVRLVRENEQLKQVQQCMIDYDCVW